LLWGRRLPAIEVTVVCEDPGLLCLQVNLALLFLWFIPAQ
jgi:hypothetical protein